MSTSKLTMSAQKKMPEYFQIPNKSINSTITQELNQQVDYVFGLDAKYDAVIVEDQKGCVLVKNFKSLQNNELLDDAVIRHFVGILNNISNHEKKDFHCYSPSSSIIDLFCDKDGSICKIEALSQSRQARITSQSTVFFPVKYNNFHWVLYAVSFRKMTVMCFDSYVDGNVIENLNASTPRWTNPPSNVEDTNSAANKIFYVLLQWIFTISLHFVAANDQFEYTKQFQCIWMRCPRQEQQVDCGVFVILAMLYVYKGSTFNYSQQQIPSARRELAAAILDNSLVCHCLPYNTCMPYTMLKIRMKEIDGNSHQSKPKRPKFSIENESDDDSVDAVYSTSQQKKMAKYESTPTSTYGKVANLATYNTTTSSATTTSTNSTGSVDSALLDSQEHIDTSYDTNRLISKTSTPKISNNVNYVHTATHANGSTQNIPSTSCEASSNDNPTNENSSFVLDESEDAIGECINRSAVLDDINLQTIAATKQITDFQFATLCNVCIHTISKNCIEDEFLKAYLPHKIKSNDLSRQQFEEQVVRPIMEHCCTKIKNPYKRALTSALFKTYELFIQELKKDPKYNDLVTKINKTLENEEGERSLKDLLRKEKLFCDKDKDGKPAFLHFHKNKGKKNKQCKPIHEFQLMMIIISGTPNKKLPWPEKSYFATARDSHRKHLLRASAAIAKKAFPESEDEQGENTTTQTKQNTKKQSAAKKPDGQVNDPQGYSEDSEDDLCDSDEDFNDIQKNSHQSRNHLKQNKETSQLHAMGDGDENESDDQSNEPDVILELMTNILKNRSSKATIKHELTAMVNETEGKVIKIRCLFTSFPVVRSLSRCPDPEQILCIVGIDELFWEVFLSVQINKYQNRFNKLLSLVIMLPFSIQKLCNFEETKYKRKFSLDGFDVSMILIEYPEDSLSQPRQLAIYTRNDIKKRHNSMRDEEIDSVFQLAENSQVFENATTFGVRGSLATPRKTMKLICKAIKVQPGDIVWDIGVGTGEFAAIMSLLTGTEVWTTETELTVFKQFENVFGATRVETDKGKGAGNKVHDVNDAR